jgi:hypothetical protein
MHDACMNAQANAVCKNSLKATIKKTNERGTTTTLFHSSQTYMLLAFWLANPDEMTNSEIPEKHVFTNSLHM